MKNLKDKTIFAFFKKKSTPFKIWTMELKKFFKVKVFYNISPFFESLLFTPPDLVIYYYPKDPKSFDLLLKELKIRFNLVRLPIILVIDQVNSEILMDKTQIVDDFITTSQTSGELLLRIKYAFARIQRISDNNPLTGLPGNTSIQHAIKLAMESLQPLAVAYVDLDNFKAFNDYYGFTKGDEIIKNLSFILISTIDELVKRENYFIGHIGGDDFVFIVPLEMAKKVSQEIIRRFNLTLPNFIESEDWERGYFLCKNRKGHLQQFPFPSLSIAIVPVYKGKFNHIGEINVRITEVKNYVKQMPGSNYFIDRRN